MSLVHFAQEGPIATITLRNPPQNRLTREVLLGFAGAVQALSENSEARVLLVRAEGSDFSLGGDITPWLGIDPAEFEATMEAGVALSNLFEDLPIPVVASIQGCCHGGGFELALRSDILIASEDTTFRHPEPTIGVFTFLGGVQRVAERIGRTRAIQWAYSAEEVTAAEAQRIGLINEVVPKEELAQATNAWVDRLAAGPTLAHRIHKQLLREWSSNGVRAADALMPKLAGSIIQTADAQGSLAGAIEALQHGKPRPVYPFEGR